MERRHHRHHSGVLTNSYSGFMTFIGNPGISLSGGTLANDGTITQIAGNGFASTQLFLINGAVIVNRGLYDIQEDGPNLTVDVPSGQAFNNLASGVLQKSAGTGTSQNLNLPFSNVGTVNVMSGTLLLDDVAQDDAGTNTLTAVRLERLRQFHADFFSSSANTLSTNNGNVTLDGPGSVFTNIAGLAANNGSFTLKDGQSFTAPGPVTNTGVLTVDATGGADTLLPPPAPTPRPPARPFWSRAVDWHPPRIRSTSRPARWKERALSPATSPTLARSAPGRPRPRARSPLPATTRKPPPAR